MPLDSADTSFDPSLPNPDADAAPPPPVITDFDALREAAAMGSGDSLLLYADARDKLEGDNSGGERGMKEWADRRSDEFHINPFLLKVREGFNSRNLESKDNQDHIDTLAKSIAEIGVKNTIIVVNEGGNLYVTDGHCRLFATFRAIQVYGADIKTVPVKTEGKHASVGDQLLSQVVRNGGKALTPFEKGTVYKKLVDFGWNEGEIAKKVGENRQNVVRLLALYSGPTEIRKLVQSGAVSANLAMDTMKRNKGNLPQAVKELREGVEQAKKEGRDVAMPRDVEAVAATPINPLAAMKESIRDAVIRAMAEPGAAAGDGYVTLRVDAIKFQRLKTLLGV